MKEKLFNLLRWSEQYTRTDMVYLASGGFWLALNQSFSSITAFIITTVLANITSPNTLGEYRFLIAGYSVLAISALPGMHTALLESTPKGFKKNLPVAFPLMIKFGLFGLLISLAIASYYLYYGNLSLALGFLVIAMILPFFEASAAFQNYLKAIKEFKLVTNYTAIIKIIVVIFTIISAMIFPGQAWIILAAFIGAGALAQFFFHKITVKKFVHADDKTDPTILSYAKHLTVMSALGIVAVQLDRMLVWKFVGAEELAIFFIAYAIPQEITRFLQIIPQLAFPKFAEAGLEAKRLALLPKMLKFLAALACGAAIYYILCPYIFDLLFPQYDQAVKYSQILIWPVITSAFLPIKTLLTSIKATRALYILNAVVPAVRIITGIFLITVFGIWGAVISIIIEAIFRTILLLFFLTKYRFLAES